MSASISFNNLSITKKIHAITCIAITAFVIIVVTNFIAMNDNKVSLDELEKSSYQVVKLTSANVALLEKLDELYTQAVTFGESDLVDSAAQTYKTINENLQNIISINDSYVHADTKKQLELYAQTSSTIATSMIDGTADFSKIQQQAQQKTFGFSLFILWVPMIVSFPSPPITDTLVLSELLVELFS